MLFGKVGAPSKPCAESQHVGGIGPSLVRFIFAWIDDPPLCNEKTVVTATVDRVNAVAAEIGRQKWINPLNCRYLISVPLCFA